MATLTYVPIATQTLSNSTTNNITFSSIPSTYTDLRLVLVGAYTAATSSVIMRFNGDTASNYDMVYLSTNGATASSGNSSNQNYITLDDYGAPATTPTFYGIDIFSYANTTTFKSLLLTESQSLTGSSGVLSYDIGTWKSTTAINSITIANLSSTVYFASGFQATLWGI